MHREIYRRNIEAAISASRSSRRWKAWAAEPNELVVEPLMIFRISQKLNAKIKVGSLPALPLDENPLADWSAHLFVANRTQYILLSNTKSL